MPTAVSAINATAGSATANAYVTQAVADQYHADRPPVGGTWGGATNDQKAQAIIWATMLMDDLWVWQGYPTDASQTLLWPRSAILKRNGWEYVDIHVVPVEIQRATAEFARQLLVADRAGDSDIETLGIKSMKVGPIDFTFKDGVYAKPVPDIVVGLVPYWWGYPRGRNTGTRELQRA